MMFYITGFCGINLLDILMSLLKSMYSSAFKYRCGEMDRHLGIDKIFQGICFKQKFFLSLLTKETLFYYEHKYFNS